jgi:hypothetical protein
MDLDCKPSLNFCNFFRVLMQSKLVLIPRPMISWMRVI